MRNIQKIVITGGPCAGKTSSLSFIQEELGNKGFSVIVVPEAATEFFSAGVGIGGKNLTTLEFQEEILATQLEKEMRFEKIASRIKNPKRIIVCDRGVMDGMAYVDPDEFLALIGKMGHTITALRDERYDGVFHLVTTALGAEKFYTNENNKTRKEGMKQARVLDQKTCRAWHGHPHLRVIDNSTDFAGKKKRLLAAICRVIGIPTPLEIEKRFLLREMPDLIHIGHRYGVHFTEISVEQMYLATKAGRQRRIRKRGQDGNFAYYLTEKYQVRPGVRNEQEAHIDPLMYFTLAQKERDKTRDIIQKKRYCFLWKNQYFELDMFIKPKRLAGLIILELELTEENDKVEWPPFLPIVREITKESSLSNYALSKKP